MKSARTKQAAVVVSVLAALCPCAFGLNPALNINQYAHNTWTVREGFFKGSIYAIAQTPDGYLWLGTEFGLVRFDGVRSLAWQPPNGDHLPGRRIRSLLAARDGRLWIGTEEGLASWKDGKLTHYAALAGKTVLSILEDREATIWAAGWGVGSTDGRLCTIRNGRVEPLTAGHPVVQSVGKSGVPTAGEGGPVTVECYGNDGRLGNGVDGLYEDRGGQLWAGTVDGVWRWKPDPAKFFPMPIFTSSFAEGAGGELFVATLDGIRKFVNEQAGAYLIRAAGQHSKFGKLLRDRDGGLWIGTYDGGLLHVYRGRTDRFTRSDGLSSNNVLFLFEDREGSMWVGTRDGLDRFREFAVPTITEKQGLSNSYVGSILRARDGSIWLGTLNGLDRWKNLEVAVYGKRDGLPDPYVLSLFEDQAGRIWLSTRRGLAYFERGKFVPVPDFRSGSVVCIVGDAAGGIWISDQHSLFHVQGQTVVEEIPWTKLGHKDFARIILPDPVRGGLWLGFREGGVAYYKDRSIRFSYGREQGVGEGQVSGLKLDDDGAIWAATGGGLSLIRGGHARRLSSANGLPCDTVHWLVEDNDHCFWLYTACGLVRVARSELERWVTDPKSTVSTTVLDNTDGVRSSLTPTDSNPIVAKSADGKIWFLSKDGVSVLDPRYLPANKIRPPVHIEEIVADEKVRWQNLTPAAHRNPSLAALTHRLEIRYTALSLVAPENVRFKYKLEGYDRDWQDAGNRRQVFYTSLPPRKYTFRVMASNNSGVWNEGGDTLGFSIAPAYYQTRWFRALLGAIVMTLLGAAYQFRIRQIQRQSRRLRDVIEAIPASVWSAQPDGSVDFISRRWRELSGLAPEHSLGWDWAGLVYPEDRAGLLETWRAAVASGNALEAEARMRGANGQYRWQLIRSVPQHDASGKIVKWYGQTTDIDDRKRAEETLRETETRFRTYIDHATDAFFVLDFEAGTILDVNSRACKNLGYTREELVGRTVFDFDAGLDQGGLDQSIQPRIEARENVTFETRHRRKDGSVFPVEIRARAFRIGGRVYNLTLALDITERKQVEEERKRAEEERERLRQLEAELAHINRVSMMGELAASVAHEVNQPLTGIVSNGSACLRMLAGESSAIVAEVREAIGDIVRDGKRAGEVIARIRAMTKKASMPREQLNLNQTIREVLVLVHDEAKKRAVVMETHYTDDLAPVLGDRVQLQQVVLNLVMNAIEAMSDVSGRPRKLMMKTQNIDGGQAQVTVEDSGIGLHRETASRIFDAFYTTKSSGMGMGLSICRSIVQSHGGRLWATSNDGPGTSFHFTLPQYHGEEQDARARAV